MTGSAEILVVGGGVVGAATAYFLSRKGVHATLVEGEHPGWGASGRNPGFQWLHTRKAGVQMELGLAGRRLADELVNELDDFEFRPCGGMTYFFDDRQTPLFQSFVDERRKAGLPMDLLDGPEARRRCPVLAESIVGATWNPLDAHQNTARLVEALVEGARRNGARIVPATKVAGLLMMGPRCGGVKTAAGDTLAADVVVLAAGAWTPALLRPLGVELPITAMRLQVAETEPAPFRFEPLLYGPTAVKQYAFIRDLPNYTSDGAFHPLEAKFPGIEFLELASQRRDGRVLLGCPMDFPGLDDRPTVAGLALTLGVLADSLPPVKSLAVERVWAGLLPQTPDALPVLGPIQGLDGLVLNAGHVFGNLAGPLSGKMIAQHLTGETTELNLDPFRFERPALRVNAQGHGRW